MVKDYGDKIVDSLMKEGTTMNFYKILNSNERHNGLQFKTGLNVDPIPFQKEGSCVRGGIYFSKKDILAFLDYGPWLRKVTIPTDTEMVLDPEKEPEKWRASKVILGKREKITIKVIERLIQEGAEVHACEDKAFRWASINGHLEIVKLLLEHGVDVHACEDEAFRWTSENGHIKVVKLLLEHGADVHASKDEAFRWASRNGHLEVVKLLLEHGADVHAQENEALRLASYNGHLGVVKLLKKMILAKRRKEEREKQEEKNKPEGEGLGKKVE